METKVRVGVRVRPLLPNEMAVGSEMVMKYPGDNSKQIGMGDRAFTYDHVFRPEVEQNALYGMTAKPMLKPFLDGYNVTIIACTSMPFFLPPSLSPSFPRPNAHACASTRQLQKHPTYS
jgi:hypothetical protein